MSLCEVFDAVDLKAGVRKAGKSWGQKSWGQVFHCTNILFITINDIYYVNERPDPDFQVRRSEAKRHNKML